MLTFAVGAVWGHRLAVSPLMRAFPTPAAFPLLRPALFSGVVKPLTDCALPDWGLIGVYMIYFAFNLYLVRKARQIKCYL